MYRQQREVEALWTFMSIHALYVCNDFRIFLKFSIDNCNNPFIFSLSILFEVKLLNSLDIAVK